MATFHDFSTHTLQGEPIQLSAFAGKKILVVNTASECGYTPQYAVMQELYDNFGGDNFTIIGFPANNFGAQEPGSNEEIASFCQANYGVTFPMMNKVSVRGPQIDPIYRWLTTKAENGVEDVKMVWNFQKFLIDENGGFAGWLAHGDSPADERILNWIQS